MLGNRVLGECNEIWNKVDGVIKKKFFALNQYTLINI